MPALIDYAPDGTVTRYDDRTLAEAQAERISAIKAAARDRIVAICPDWKQANLTARAAELALAGGPKTDAERAEVAAGAAIWAQIKAVRAASDTAEAAVLAAKTNEDADAVTF